MFVNMMLPFMQAEGMQFLENNFDDLIAAIKQQAIKSDCTWQKIVKAVDFQKESQKIEKYLHSSECKLSEDQRKDIQTCFMMNECQFDLKTVKAYQQTILALKNLNEANKHHFSVYLKTDRQRVESYYEQRFANFIDEATLKALENELDPGFLKMCGLKGSKLSGG